MSAEREAPTRATLLRLRRQRAQVAKGTELLRREREALVAELFRLARPAAHARATIDERLAEAWPSLLAALAVHGDAGLRALGWPSRELRVTLTPGVVWGVVVSDVRDVPPLRRTPEARGVAPGSAGPAAAETARQFELALELLIDAAPAEQRLRRLGDAVSRVGRRLRTLEQRVAPALDARAIAVRRTLEEREREEHLRLKHVKRRRDRGGRR